MRRENVVAVLIPFAGDINGMLLQIYKEMKDVILRKLLGTEQVPEEMDGQMLDLLRRRPILWRPPI